VLNIHSPDITFCGNKSALGEGMVKQRF